MHKYPIWSFSWFDYLSCGLFVFSPWYVYSIHVCVNVGTCLCVGADAHVYLNVEVDVGNWTQLLSSLCTDTAFLTNWEHPSVESCWAAGSEGALSPPSQARTAGDHYTHLALPRVLGIQRLLFSRKQRSKTSSVKVGKGTSEPRA